MAHFEKFADKRRHPRNSSENYKRIDAVRGLTQSTNTNPDASLFSGQSRSSAFDPTSSFVDRLVEGGIYSLYKKPLFSEMRKHSGRAGDGGSTTRSDLMIASEKGRLYLEKVNRLTSHESDPDDRIAYKRRYKSKTKALGDRVYYVKTRLTSNEDDFMYRNIIDIKNGKIILKHNFRVFDDLKGEGGSFNNSAIIKNQILDALEMDGANILDFKLKEVEIKRIVNLESTPMLKLLAPQRGNPYSFQHGTDGFNAAFAVPITHAASFLSKQYPGSIGVKELTEVKIQLMRNDEFNMTIYMNDVSE